MQIDDHFVPIEIEKYYRESLNNLSDAAFIIESKKFPSLMEGLNQKSPNIKTLRERVNGKLDGKSIPGPVLALLRESTLSDRLFAVLSFNAIKHGGEDWSHQFGASAYVGSLLLDDREEVRAFAREVWPRLVKKGTTSSGACAPTSVLLDKFAPFVEVIRGLGIPPESVQVTQTPSVPPVQKTLRLSKQEEDKLIEGSTLVKRLQRTAKEQSTEIGEKTREIQRLASRLKHLEADLQSSQGEVRRLQTEMQVSISSGIADALTHRLGHWIAPSEALDGAEQTASGAIDEAKNLLQRQAQIDRRFGTISQLRAESAEAHRLKEQLRAALQESLRPLPELQRTIVLLDQKIQDIDAVLQRGSIAPDTPRLKDVFQRLQATKTIEEAMSIRAGITHETTHQTWTPQERTKALELAHRRILAMYAQTDRLGHVRHEELHKIAPLETLRQCLITGNACCILIDGHNLLHKIKPFIDSKCFDKNGGPNVLARGLLIDLLCTLVGHHPNIQCELWFDGPVDTQWSEVERLKVLFSGGQGANRADARIHESLQAHAYQGIQAEFIVVSDDRDVVKNSEKLHAFGMSPVEFWMGFLAGS